MKKLWNFLKNNILKIGVAFLIAFIPLYPKLPSVHINHTWVYIRVEDFLILAVVIIWGLQFILRRVKLPPKLWIPVAAYWVAGLLSLAYSLIFIGPHIANFFPKIAALYYVRHIEYMILFFVAFSTIKSKKDIRDYLIVFGVTIFGFSLYAFGQRFYLDLWNAFPGFFEHYSFCFPSFQTGNEQFAKGIPLCLPQGARMTATFAGSYDLGAYLVMLIPVFTAVIFAVKKKLHKLLTFILVLVAVMTVIFTSSRISFVAYLAGITAALFFINKKKFIIPFYILSIALLLIFSGSTAKRFLETFRIASVVTNNQGQVVGQASLPADLKNKIASNSLILANTPTQNLPAGTGYLGLPQITAPQSTTSAVVQSNLSVSEAKRLKLDNGGVEISTVSGSFLIRKVLVYDISFTTRFQAEWPNAWNAFLRNPLLGSGFATVTLAVDNNLLRILAETGLLGMAAFLSIFLCLALVLKQAASHIDDKLSKAFLFGLAGGIFGLFLNATLIDVFEASKVAETMWILLGLAAGLAFVYRKDYKYKTYIQKVLTSHPFIIFYLFVLLVVFFLKSLTNFFVADDFTWLHWAASSTLSQVPKYFTNSAGFFYRPLDKTVMFFLYTLFSFGFQGYHIAMLLIHFLVALGVYVLAYKIFKNKLLSFIAGFIFLFIPAIGENVFWIATISTNLSTLFIVYMLIFWLNFREKENAVFYVLSFVFAVLAFLSYEGAIILLPLIVLLDLFISKVKVISAKTFLKYSPFALITVLYPFVRLATHSVNFGGDYSYSLSHLLPNFVGNFLGYFGLFVLGEPFLPFYTMSRTALRGDVLYVAVFLFFAIIALGVIVFVNKKRLENWYKSESIRFIVFCLLFSFIGLIPFLGLGNLSERYGYLAAVGFALLLAFIFGKISNLAHKNNIKIAILVVLTILLGSWYYYQNGVENAQWHEAGRITQRTLGYLRLFYDGSHPNANFYFVNVPIKKDQAWIFPVGLSDGIWFIYRDNTIKVHEINSLSEGEKIAAEKIPNSFVFAFDKNNNIYAVK